MLNLKRTTSGLVAALLICASCIQAQDQKQTTPPANPSAPIPPIDSGLGGGYSKPPAPAARGVASDIGALPYDPSQVTPDQNTLAGAEFFSVGSLQRAHNVFDPAISITQLGETIPNTAGQQTLESVSLAGGSLNFDRTWSRYHLTTLYNGGETFTEGGQQIVAGQVSPHSQFHDLVFTQQADWARWHILIRDDFIAAPGATFTGTGMGGPGLVAQFSSMLNTTLNSIGQEFVPSDSIETGAVMRYRNALLGQAEYSFTRRSAFTFSGSYGILHFASGNYFSSRMLDAQAGYDYLLDPKNSIAVLVSYGKIDYTGSLFSTLDYMAAFAYGRKITGHLAFQVAAGPQQIQTSTTSGVGDFKIWFESVNSALTYERRRATLSAAFTRGLTSGSGVFLGSTANTFSGSARYLFTRFWTGAASGGYALNKSLAAPGVAATQFDNWFIGGTLGRRLGPHMNLNFNYGLQRQNNPSSCPVTSCGVTGFQQTFGMTVDWHMRPVG